MSTDRVSVGAGPGSVRSARLEDAPSIAEVHVRSWQAAYRGIVPDPVLDALSIERRRSIWERILSGDVLEQGVWVAEIAGRVVGFAYAGPPQSDDAPSGSGELSAIYLLSEAWSQGFGRALHQKVIDHLTARGFRQAILWVFAANDRARRFYERLGWQPDGIAGAFTVGGVDLPTVRYEIDLAHQAGGSASEDGSFAYHREHEQPVEFGRPGADTSGH